MSCFDSFLLLFLLLLALYKSSQFFRYACKFAFYFVYISTASIILMPYFALSPCNVNNLIVASYVSRYISSVFGIKWNLKGKKFLSDDSPCVIVSNHQSAVDVLGMFDIWPIMGRCAPVGKRELLYIFPFGLAAWLAGLVFINRREPSQAKSQMNQAALWAKKEKIKLWIFPEGTRRDTGKIDEFKKGAFYTAIYAQLPILPVVFSNYYFLNSREKRFDPGEVIITVLPPIPTEGMTVNDLEKLMSQTRTAMENALFEANKEVRELANIRANIK
ncbi:1-acyl-sn-glycerol-3-phosphate acyltransferase alpha isoform X2 [Agrilus planipennis]|uniref:1-acyl-sn-glycerol-3-phosphate acyltransferase n=1 Tax=Agrilus planipennis TaxID=224129 RepID=A0A7F5R8D0_AGRPL|nr:1-acyl-sn-glycerol-3-phosphate acyltransferase alpha isoform X1 [Agrilus planipennis]XP_025832221.1 1-acyl-sn-glycerol-3-phosphate acyltransferase alpha isoform X2 [Agrilus planipennis]